MARRSLPLLSALLAVSLTAALPRAELQTSRPAAGTARRLVGTWQLVTRTVSVKGKALNDPVLGAQPLGRLSYDAGGSMSLQMMRQGRKSAIGTPTDVTDKANPRVILGYDSYFGKYSVDERAGTITHHVEASLFPEDLGQAWVRPFTLDGDALTLSFTSPTDGVSRTLVFRRELILMRLAAEVRGVIGAAGAQVTRRRRIRTQRSRAIHCAVGHV